MENDYMEPMKNDKEPINEAFHTINKPTDSKPLIAGILLIIAGIMAILTWLLAFSVDISTILDQSMFQEQNITITTEQLQSMVSICASIGVILSIFPLLGGILSIQKKLWGGALAGSIIGLFTIGPLFLSSLLSLISLILLIMAREQFQTKDTSIDEY
jgi:hypothetical protein